MSNAGKLILALVVVGVIATGIVMVASKDSGEDKTTGNTNTSGGNSNTEGDSESSDAPAQEAVTITYDESGFSPAEVKVTAGGTVTFVNNSDETVEPSSDDHPTHTVNPELTAGEVAPGASKSVTVDSTGTWGYHNHLNASETGTVIVE